MMSIILKEYQPTHQQAGDHVVAMTSVNNLIVVCNLDNVKGNLSQSAGCTG